MPTPAYQGPGQPSVDGGSGWFGRLGSLFGGTQPAYASAPVPTITPVTPVPATPPTAPAPDPSDPVALPACPIDPADLPPGGIVLVVPRRSDT